MLLFFLFSPQVRPDCIDLRALNTPAEDATTGTDTLTAERAEENIQLVLGAAQSIGVRKGEVTPQCLLEPAASKRNALLTTTFVWELVKQQWLQGVDVRKRYV